MKSLRQAIAPLICASLLVSGCTGPGAPIEDRTPAQDGARTAEPVTPAPARTMPAPVPAPQREIAIADDIYRVPPPVAASAPLSPAVQSLMAAATQSAAQGNWDRAQAALERAIKLAPDKPALWRQLAYTHFRNGKLDQAREVAQRALVLSSGAGHDEAEIWRLIADIEAARGNVTAAASARANAGGAQP